MRYFLIVVTSHVTAVVVTLQGEGQGSVRLLLAVRGCGLCQRVSLCVRVGCPRVSYTYFTQCELWVAHRVNLQMYGTN